MISRKIILLITYSVILQSCIYEYSECRVDNEENINVTITNIWSYSPDANPEGMAYLFYPHCGPEPWRFDFPGRDAGNINLPAGIYKFLMFNDDTYRIKFRNYNNPDSIEIYCSNIDIDEWLQKSGISDNIPDSIDIATPICAEPDIVWAFSDDDILVSPEKNTCIITYPRQITAKYSYEITDVINSDGILKMCGALSGLSAGIRIHGSSHSDTIVTMPCSAYKSGDCTISGQMTTFGLPPGTSSSNILYLIVKLADQSIMAYTFDVTSQIRQAENPLNVHILIKGLKLPQVTPSVEGAFDATVDNWTKISINITDNELL